MAIEIDLSGRVALVTGGSRGLGRADALALARAGADGTFLLEKDDRPDGKDTAALVGWVEANDTALVAGGIIFGFGVLFFVWVLGSLRSALLEAEGGAGRLSAIAFGSGIATSVCLMALSLFHAQAAFDHDDISDTSIDALVHVGDAFFGGVELFSIPLLLATAILTLRHGPLPRWLAGLVSCSCSRS